MPIDLTVAQTAAPSPTVWLALLQGIVSFVSPCVLPLLPVYFAALLGSGGQTLRRREVVLRFALFLLFLTMKNATTFVSTSTLVGSVSNRNCIEGTKERLTPFWLKFRIARTRFPMKQSFAA